MDVSSLYPPEGAKRSYVIYGLYDPRVATNLMATRYVGVTTRSLESRLGGHIGDAKRGSDTHKDRWIRKLLVAGVEPVIIALDKCDVHPLWQLDERKWIANLKTLGCELTNSCAGGRGVLCPSEDSLEKRRRPRRQMSMVCSHCGKSFQRIMSKKYKTPFCCDEHRKAAQSASTRVYQCAGCGKDVKRIASKVVGNVYCSNKCQSRVQARVNGVFSVKN